MLDIQTKGWYNIIMKTMETNKYQKERISQLVMEQSRDEQLPVLAIAQITDTLYELTYDNDSQSKEIVKINKYGKIIGFPKAPIYSKYY
jgi:hypothetical protein